MDVPKYFQFLAGELDVLKNRVHQFIDGRHWLTDGHHLCYHNYKQRWES